MAGKFELKSAKSGQFHFNLLAGNGQIILQSEMYESKASALNGIASIQKNAGMDERYERLVSKSRNHTLSLKLVTIRSLVKAKCMKEKLAVITVLNQ